MSVKQRIIDFIKHLGISQRAFEKEIGLSNGYINNISISIGHDKLLRISKHYPDLNTEWLMTGEGQMLRNEYFKEESTPIVVEETRETYQTINRLVAMNEKLFEENRVLKEELDSLKRALNVQGKSA